MNQYAEDFIKKAQEQAKKNNDPQPNIHDLAVMAKQYAKDEVAREQKHLKAFTKGARTYKYLGRTFQVLTEENILKQAETEEENGQEELSTEEQVV